jgi:hypothetical protein
MLFPFYPTFLILKKNLKDAYEVTLLSGLSFKGLSLCGSLCSVFVFKFFFFLSFLCLLPVLGTPVVACSLNSLSNLFFNYFI